MWPPRLRKKQTITTKTHTACASPASAEETLRILASTHPPNSPPLRRLVHDLTEQRPFMGAHLHMATRLSKLWGMTEAHLAHINLPPPFWAFVWPGAHGMACYLRDHPNTVANKPVVDLACGSGVLAILALQHGATTATAIDIDPVACTAAHLNAEISLATDQQAQLQVKLMDATTYFPPVPAVVLAGDVCYHQPMASQMILHLRRLQAAGHTVLLADPGRRYRPKSDQTARGCYTVQTDIDIEDEHQKTVCIYHLHADIPPS